MTKTEPVILKRFQSQPLSEESLEKAPPMPTGGMQAIASICSEAADMMKAAASFRPSGLGHVVAGNNALLPPPAQQVSGVNAGTLAALAGLAKAAASAPQQEQKETEKEEGEKKEPKEAKPIQAAQAPAQAPAPNNAPQAKANPPAAAPVPAPARKETIKVKQPVITKSAGSWWKDMNEAFLEMKTDIQDFFKDKEGPKPSNSEGIF